jgi:NRAMP (natural resistance-associated macrophage protein)-like metal ion transporter
MSIETNTPVEGVHKNNFKNPIKVARSYLQKLGPGIITGAADDDPSGIATYSQTGAKYGFQLLWMSLFSFPFMALTQEMCARIGMVTGEGLAANIRHHYPKYVLYTCASLLFIANTFNLGADLGAMAAAVQLIAPMAPFGLLVLFFAVTSLILQVFTTYEQYAKYLKYLTVVLFAYMFTALIADVDWGMVLKSTLIPKISFEKEQFLLICAILGTTISPYLFFWQTSQEVEEEISLGRDTVEKRRIETSDKEIHDMRVDVWSGMFVSNFAMFFIITTCAATLFTNGITNISTADQAAVALRPLAGDYAYFLFAIGIIGVGLLGIPILAGSAAYAISESFDWKFGLYRKLKEAYAFYGVIALSTLIGLLMNFIGIDPIKALIYSAVANGLVAPIMIYFIVRISSNKDIMGTFVNSKYVTIMGWLTVFLMSLAGVAVIVTSFL